MRTQIKIGDYVTKIDGARHQGRSGVVLQIHNKEWNSGGYKIAEVLSDGELVKWACHLLEVINESR